MAVVAVAFGAVAVGTGAAAEELGGSQGTDTSLPPTDSEVTVLRRDRSPTSPSR